MAQPYSGGARAPRKKRPKGRGRIGPDGPRYQESPGAFNSGDPRQPKPPKRPRFGNQQTVKGGVEQRARRRLKAVGKVKGVNAQDGITGREARKIKRKWNRQGRPGRPGPSAGGGAGNPNRGAPRPPVDPFASEVNALTELQYGGQQRELQAQARISDQQQVNVGNWYQNYQQQVQQAAGSQAAYTKGFQDAAYQQANQAAVTDQGQNQQLLQQQQTQAAQRGMTVDPSVAQNMQAGVAARQTAGTAGGNLLAQQGQAQGAYLANRVGVAGAQGIQAQQDEARKRATIAQLTQDLQKEMGAFKVKARADIQGREHTQRLENQAFGLDVAQERFDQSDARADNRRSTRKDRVDARDKRIDNRREKAKLRLDRDKYGLDVRKENRMRDQDLADDGRLNGSSGGSSGGKSKYTQSQRNSNQESFRKGRSFAGQLKGFSPREKIQVLTNKENIDPLIARAIVAPNTLNARQRAELRRMGIKPKETSWQERTGRGGIDAIRGVFD